MRRYLRSLGNKREILISNFKGVHTAFEEDSCPDEYSPCMKNISSSAYPGLKTREGRENIASTEGQILFMGCIEGKYLSCVIKNNGICKWMYFDKEWKEICTVEESKEGRYDLIYFINATILVCGVEEKKNGISYGISYVLNFSDGKANVTKECVMPLGDMTDTINGRMAAAYSGGSDVYLGGAMDRGVWFEIDDGLHLNIITQNCENISAIKTYGGHLVCFKEHSFGEIYGNTPDTYTHITVSEMTGCVAEKTICDCGRLLWLSEDGVCSYGGGALPQIISSPIQKYIDNIDIENRKNACAGFDGKHYIITLPQIGGKKINCVLDVEKGIWTIHDNLPFIGFCNMNGNLYGATESGEILKLFSEGDESVPWQWKSKSFGSGIFRKKGLRRIYVEAEYSGELCVKVLGDNVVSGAEETFTNKENKMTKRRLHIDLHPGFLGRCDTFSINLQGEGVCRVLSIDLLLRNKNISYL